MKKKTHFILISNSQTLLNSQTLTHFPRQYIAKRKLVYKNYAIEIFKLLILVFKIRQTFENTIMRNMFKFRTCVHNVANGKAIKRRKSGKQL